MVLLGGDLQVLDHFDDRHEEEVDAIEHMMAVTGLAGFHEDRVGGVGPIVESAGIHRQEIFNVWRLFSLQSLYEYSQRATYDQLDGARRRWQELQRLAVAMANTTKMTSGPPNSYGMAMAPYLPKEDKDHAITTLMVGALEEYLGPDRMEQSLVALRPELSRQEAFGEIIHQVPYPLRRYLGVQGVERQERASTAILTELQNRLDEIEAKHPELFEACKNKSSTNGA
jgi:hypothetical protein